jgi:hypothetical protein
VGTSCFPDITRDKQPVGLMRDVTPGPHVSGMAITETPKVRMLEHEDIWI